MCECKIEKSYNAQHDDIDEKIVFGPCHAAAPQLQAENEKLREALKLVKDWIRELNRAYLRGTYDLTEEQARVEWEKKIVGDSRLRQINEALKGGNDGNIND